MQDWIIEADIYRLRKQLAADLPVAEATALQLRLFEKTRQLAKLGKKPCLEPVRLKSAQWYRELMAESRHGKWNGSQRL